MFDWIAQNLGTLLISAVLIAIVTSIIIFLIRQKKRGKSSCGCNCAHCALHGQCTNSNDPGADVSLTHPPDLFTGG